MIRKIKVLGLAIVAVAAMSGTTASVTQASEFHATIAKKAVLTGIQHVENVFQTTTPNGPKVRCSVAVLEGTIEQQSPGQQVTTQDATVTPTYTGALGAPCQALGQAATIITNGCKYTVTGAGQPALTSVVDVAGCTQGKQIEIITSICTITIPAQNSLSQITYSNAVGTPHTVTAQANVTGIIYQLHGVGCGHTVTLDTTDGTYTGAFHVQAYEDIVEPDLVTKHKHQYNELTHGAAVGLLAT